jgi:hypothetical protein
MKRHRASCDYNIQNQRAKMKIYLAIRGGQRKMHYQNGRGLG